MKKIIFEIITTLIIVLGIFFSGGMVKNSVLAVDVYKVNYGTVEDTVVCSGKIEYKESCIVNPPTAGVVTEVLVEKGDIVNKGDILFSMVTNLTTDNIAQTNNRISELVDNKSVTVKAPTSGTILNINISADDTIIKGFEAVTIVNSQDLCVKLPVSEGKISDLQVGQSVKITGTAFNDYTYAGKISTIDNIAQQVVTSTGKETAVEVLVDILNPDEKIKQGYTAKCTITTNTKENSCIVPYNAIETTEDSKGIVYLYQNGKVVEKTVDIGNEYKNGVEVLSELKENEYIIAISDEVISSNSVKINKLVGNSNA